MEAWSSLHFDGVGFGFRFEGLGFKKWVGVEKRNQTPQHYPEGRHGGRFTAWRLEPTSLEVVSIGNGVISARDDWRAPGLRRSQDGRWEPGA